MNFFDRQDHARKTTRKLIFLFLVAVLGIVIAIDFVAGVILASAQSQTMLTIPSLAWAANNSWFLLGSSLGTLGFIGVSSLAKVAALSSGGGKVARSLGGTLVTPDVRDPLRQRLHNVVEEMSIASGVPVPDVYVLEEESGINAFAAGFTTGDAAVAVTRGALDRLTRSELQGVIAHEFSHILNGDMRLNMRLIGILFGILVIGLIGRIILRAGSNSSRITRSRDSRGHGAVLALGGTLFVVGYLGFFFGRLIKAAVSRQREYLADASAVQFTRETEGLSGALKKIGGFESGSEVQDSGSEEISHMFFARGVLSLRSLFSTHPPLTERIQALDPKFKSDQFGRGLPPTDDIDAWTDISSERTSGFAPSHVSSQISGEARSITDTVGNPTLAHVAHASHIRASIPQPLYEAAQGQEGAMLLLIALILNPDRTIRSHQLGMVREKVGSRRCERIDTMYDELEQVGHRYRLPLLEIAFPTLKARPPAQLQFLVDFVRKLVHTDGQVEPFEYALTRMLMVHLGDAKRPRRSIQRKPNRELADLASHIGNLLAVMAWAGHGSDNGAAVDAYNAGRSHLMSHDSHSANANWRDYEIPKDWLAVMDNALDQCDRLEDKAKQTLIEALVRTISHDDHINLEEGEFLRAICATLHCPLPPLI